MKASLLLGGIVLGAAATFGALYTKLTAAAPAATVASVAPAPAAPPLVFSASSASATGPAPPAVTLSPETARLEQRRVLYETVDALLQASEFERARKLLDEEQQRHGDDAAQPWRDLEQGYRLIADCLEHPSSKHRARGEAFLLVNEAVALGPKLRAACAHK